MDENGYRFFISSGSKARNSVVMCVAYSVGTFLTNRICDGGYLRCAMAGVKGAKGREPEALLARERDALGGCMVGGVWRRGAVGGSRR